MHEVDARDVRAIAPAGVEVVSVDPRTCDPALADPGESASVRGAPAQRRREHAAGRAAARMALECLGVPAAPLLGLPDGAPLWPAGTRGSISHKPELCLAVVGRAESIFGLGVDVEVNRPLPGAVLSAVLTTAERAGPAGIDVHEARLVFSAKEAYYKWYASVGMQGNPGFHDIEVERRGNELSLRPVAASDLPSASGTCAVNAERLVTLVWGEPVRALTTSRLHAPRR